MRKRTERKGDAGEESIPPEVLKAAQARGALSAGRAPEAVRALEVSPTLLPRPEALELPLRLSRFAAGAAPENLAAAQEEEPRPRPRARQT